MEVPCTETSYMARYIEQNHVETLEEREPEFEHHIALIQRFKPIKSDTSILEIGTGMGTFPLMCKARGIKCRGLEISPQLVEYAMRLGRRHGIQPDIELGNIETSDIGKSSYDVILAMSVLEHVEHWRPALQRIYDALKPGGLFLFNSTNKFSFVSGEYSFPLYGWLPDRWRYRLRVARQGPEVMTLGIDFNQFTYPQLRREFRNVGFSQILDRVELADAATVANPWKRRVLHACRRSRLVKAIVLTFCDATVFACIK